MHRHTVRPYELRYWLNYSEDLLTYTKVYIRMPQTGLLSSVGFHQPEWVDQVTLIGSLIRSLWLKPSDWLYSSTKFNKPLKWKSLFTPLFSKPHGLRALQVQHVCVCLLVTSIYVWILKNRSRKRSAVCAFYFCNSSSIEEGSMAKIPCLKPY